MKKSLLLFLLLVGLGYSQEITDLSDMQKFYYNKGYKDASKEFYLKGYSDAVNFLKKELIRYKQKIQALEAGKYLIKKSKITYPEVYKIKKDDMYSIYIEPSKIEKEFSVDELFVIPLVEKEDIKNIEAIKNDSNIYINSFELTGDIYRPTNSYLPSSFEKQTSILLPKTNSVKNIVDSMNLKYVDEPSNYKVYFNSDKQKEEFCKKITKNRECDIKK